MVLPWGLRAARPRRSSSSRQSPGGTPASRKVWGPRATPVGCSGPGRAPWHALPVSVRLLVAGA
eukprot:839215-Alexandrium_andersonii.AAC.1